MSLTTKLHVALTVALLAAVAFFARQWLAAHDAYLRAESQSKSSQSAIAQLNKQQSDLVAQLKQAQAGQQAQLAALHKDYAQAQSPEQLAALITRVLNLPQPITIATPGDPPTASASSQMGSATNLAIPNSSVRVKQGSFPSASAGNPAAQVPLPDAPQIKAFVEQCQECQIRLATANQEAAINSQQIAALRQQVTITEQDRDTWKRAAKGGSWPRRAVRRATAFAVDAGLTTLALCASHHCK